MAAVYFLQCHRDGKTVIYIGSTTRTVAERLEEHQTKAYAKAYTAKFDHVQLITWIDCDKWFCRSLEYFMKKHRHTVTYICEENRQWRSNWLLAPYNQQLIDRRHRQAIRALYTYIEKNDTTIFFHPTQLKEEY